MSQRREPPDSDGHTSPAVPRPRQRENTVPGGYGAPGPRLYEGRYDLLDRKLKQERSISPLPSPASVPKVEDTSTPSFRPGRELIGTAIRRADPRWLGLTLTLAVLVWAVGGPTGIRELIAAWQSTKYTNEIAALSKRLEELEARAGRAEAAAKRRDENDVKFRSDASQVVGRLGVRWSLPDGIPPQRQLEFITPLRKPDQVKGGPSLVVVQPVPMP